MEALSQVLNWMFLGAIICNDLIIVAESLDELKMRLKNWKEGLKEKKSCTLELMLLIPRSHLSNFYAEYAEKMLEQTQSSI